MAEQTSYFSVFDTDGYTPLTGQASSCTALLVDESGVQFESGVTTTIPVTIAETSVTGRYTAKFTPTSTTLNYGLFIFTPNSLVFMGEHDTDGYEFGETRQLFFIVFDSDGITPKSGYVDGDFTKTLIFNTSSSSLTMTITEIDSSGVYMLSYTPDVIGDYCSFIVDPMGDTHQARIRSSDFTSSKEFVEGLTITMEDPDPLIIIME